VGLFHPAVPLRAEGQQEVEMKQAIHALVLAFGATVALMLPPLALAGPAEDVYDEPVAGKTVPALFFAGRVLSCNLKVFPTQLAKEPKLPQDHKATLTIDSTSVVLASESAGIMKLVSITKVLDSSLALDDEGVLLLNEEKAGTVKAGGMTFFTPLDSKTMASSTYFLVADCP
jgi:hypothetical protein